MLRLLMILIVGELERGFLTLKGSGTFPCLRRYLSEEILRDVNGMRDLSAIGV